MRGARGCEIRGGVELAVTELFLLLLLLGGSLDIFGRFAGDVGVSNLLSGCEVEGHTLGVVMAVRESEDGELVGNVLLNVYIMPHYLRDR